MVKEDVFCLVTQRSMHVDKSLPRWTTRGSLVSWDSITISSVCIRCWVVHPGHATMLSKLTCLEEVDDSWEPCP